MTATRKEIESNPVTVKQLFKSQKVTAKILNFFETIRVDRHSQEQEMEKEADKIKQGMRTVR